MTAFILAIPAEAWETRSDAICVLEHSEESADVRLTYDPGSKVYSIAITPAQPWRSYPVFAIRFEGPRSLTISTGRHTMTEDGGTLAVTDSGFGNVLNGLEFNHTATALLGDQAVEVSLDGAAPAVQDFRTCASGQHAFLFGHSIPSDSLA